MVCKWGPPPYWMAGFVGAGNPSCRQLYTFPARTDEDGSAVGFLEVTSRVAFIATTDIWASFIFSIQQHHWPSVNTQPHCDNCRCLQTLLNVPRGTKFPPVESHCSIRMDEGEIVLEDAINRRSWKFVGRLTVFGSYNNVIWVLKLKLQFGPW